MEHTGLNRRDAMRRLALAGAGAATSALWVDTLSALAREQAPHVHAAESAVAATDWTPKVLNAHQDETVTTLCELIIPQTDTPGAKAALVNRFVDAILQEAQPGEKHTFLTGLAWMDARSRTLFGEDFLSATAAQQTDLLTKLSTPGYAAGEERTGLEFFQAIKSMTITGYYTTRIGLQQELGDDGQLFLVEFVGCNHPEHQG